MPLSVLEYLSRGPFAFIASTPQAVGRVVPDAEQSLPKPQRIFLEDEDATPLVGYPILRTQALDRLDAMVVEYLEAEEQAQVAFHTRSTFDSRTYASRWEMYKLHLVQVVENTLVSSRSYDYASVFWLLHSLPIARRLQELPRRLRRSHSVVGRDHGDSIKYRVFDKWLDRVTGLVGEITRSVAEEMGHPADQLFPATLALMRDNVLALTEDYISPDLSELQSFFSGFLRIDGRDFRQRFEALRAFSDQLLATDPLVAAAATALIEESRGSRRSPPPEARDGSGAGAEPSIVFESSWARFLSHHPSYDPARFFHPTQLATWEDLLDRLKRREVLHALRKSMVPLKDEDGSLVSRDRSFNTTWVGGPEVIEVSSATRPIDFFAPWVVDPRVERFGLVYDITEFSGTLSELGRRQTTALEDAFRMTAKFQRAIDRFAGSVRLRLEKYLGDGAFYSGRHPLSLLHMALHIQRLYPQFVAQGFPFDRGLRIALNFGEYRLLPLESEERGSEPRYEFFGHGLVELSRLSSGKKTEDVDALRAYLVSQGYPETAVAKFFAPLERRQGAAMTSKLDERRDFYAYINANGTLINEGIVATESFVEHLGEFESMAFGRLEGRGFIVLPLAPGGPYVGLRRLGAPSFKGLDPKPVYEVVDGRWKPKDLRPLAPQPLVAMLERLFNQNQNAQRERQARRPG